MTITMRGHCQVCNRRRRIRRNGMVRNHRRYETVEPRSMYGDNPLCAGSGLPPLELIRDAENNWHCNTGCTGCRDMIDYGV